MSENNVGNININIGWTITGQHSIQFLLNVSLEKILDYLHINTVIKQLQHSCIIIYEHYFFYLSKISHEYNTDVHDATMHMYTMQILQIINTVINSIKYYDIDINLLTTI